MAATTSHIDFDTWLVNKLRSLNTDESVFSSYIKGILEGDETDDEKNESLEGIISGITDNGIPQHCQEIIEQWHTFSLKTEATTITPVDIDVRLMELLENQAKPTIVAREYTDEEKKLREAILAQYSHMSDEEEGSSECPNGTAAIGPSPGSSAKPSTGLGVASGVPKVSNALTRNTNVDDVVKAEKERRDKSKQEAIQKKEKDKEDREKQKQAQQEKKEKRKTQKHERRR